MIAHGYASRQIRQSSLFMIDRSAGWRIMEDPCKQKLISPTLSHVCQSNIYFRKVLNLNNIILLHP